jgi:hypothetical protein
MLSRSGGRRWNQPFKASTMSPPAAWLSARWRSSSSAWPPTQVCSSTEIEQSGSASTQ